jgi:hypothetical protein
MKEVSYSTYNDKEKLIKLLAHWRSDPVLGVRSLFGVEPTEQQKGLIYDAWHPQARVAVSSCQGAGKTASLVWLMFLFLLTQEDCRILITSPSYQQLARVFSSEIAKWHHKMPKFFQDQFVILKESVAIKGKEQFQIANMVTASAEHKENLQGGHSTSYVILADEASGIEEAVFDLLLGTLSTHSGGRFILTSNPLRASGRFYEIFHRENLAAKWRQHYFSALDSPVINEQWIQEMEETYGLDSDIYRVRVLGQFPRSATTQFFRSDKVTEAISNDIPRTHYGAFPRVAGVDIARFGDDLTVFVLRQGPKVLHIEKYSGLDNMEVVSKLVEFYQKWQPSLINMDAIGVGTGPFDRAKELGLPVHPVVVSQKSTDPLQYCNLRAQLYGLCREWLYNGADIPNDQDFEQQFLSVEYGFTPKMQIQMAQKKLIKAKGLPSPDIVDALTLTFAGEAITRRSFQTKPRPVQQSNYFWV